MHPDINLSEYGLRLASIADIPFVLSLVVDGAKTGHYLDTLLDPKHQKAYQAALEQVVQFGGMARLSERGPEIIDCKLLIYCNNNGDRIGFIMVSEKMPGSVREVLEIYKASIKEDKRRLGHGRNMISTFINNYPLPVKYYARCYPASVGMISLLTNLGFNVAGRTKGGTFELEFKQKP